MKNRSVVYYIGCNLVFFCLIFTLLTCSNPAGSSEPGTEDLKIIEETNKVRTNPIGYAAMLRTEMAGITDLGTKARYQAAIDTLEKPGSQCSPLKYEKGLYLAASDHARDMIKKNFFDHKGSDGSSPGQRISRYGTCSTWGENIAGGYSNASSVVKGWVLSPGHLSNILYGSFTQMGAVHMSGHRTYNWISVQVFARNFASK